MKRNSLGQFEKGSHWREPKPFREKEWLVSQYVQSQRSTGDIAKEFGTTDAAILFWLKKHGIPRRDVSAARKVKRWGLIGESNPMWNRRGSLNPHWLGGVTPERQAFYASDEWKRACSAVWKRDNATCQRCGERKTKDGRAYHVHHIESFANKARRADVANLTLLCEECHGFVHSRKNVNREHLPQKPDP